MKSRFPWFLFLAFIFLLSGCTHVISKDLRTKSDPSLTFRQVRQNPDAFKEKLVVWGGEIIETVNQRNGTTQVEIFQRPLGWRGEPKETNYSEGRFLVFADTYLDPYTLRRGKRITVGGEIIGEKTKLLGEWIIVIPLFQANRSIFGLNTITNPIPITIIIHGGVLIERSQAGRSSRTRLDRSRRRWHVAVPAHGYAGARSADQYRADGQWLPRQVGYLPHYVFFTDTQFAVTPLTPYLAWTNNISFSLSNRGDEVLLLDGNDQLVDGVAWGTGSLLGNVSCLAIDPNNYPLGNPSIKREPLWKDSDNCPNDFVVDETATP